MRNNSKKAIIAMILLLVALINVSCNQRRIIYNHYEHTPLSGWEKNDSLCFDVKPVAEAGTYRKELGVRISNDFPFLGITMEIRQTILPSGKTTSRDIECKFIDKNGFIQGSGISLYQYSYPLDNVTLEKGDSLHIVIRHNMKREIMPGIPEIGILLEKN